MSIWDKCVIDATMGVCDGMFCFCPIEGDIRSKDFTIVTGMNIISDKPPMGMQLVGIVHEGGQEAVEKFCDEHTKALELLREKKSDEDNDF